MIKSISVLHEPSQKEPFLILSKPRGLPSAPLKDGDECAYTQAENLFPELRNVVGKKIVEHGLVHRIDTETQGLLLIASSQAFYDYMQDIQNKGLFIKTYKALCDVKIKADIELSENGFPSSPDIDFKGTGFDCIVKSQFRPYGVGRKEVRPVDERAGRAAMKKASPDVYETCICGKFKDEKTECNVTCSITKGYRHQVRCHLAWIGLPIKGDPIYSSIFGNNVHSNEFFFTASGLRFPNIDGNELSFSI